MGKAQSCIFCDILKKDQAKILKEDDEFFAFHDISKASASEHILVCTKEHIDNAKELHSPEQVQRMQRFGE